MFISHLDTNEDEDNGDEGKKEIDFNSLYLLSNIWQIFVLLLPHVKIQGDDEAADEAVDEPAVVEPAAEEEVSISPTVWYSVGGVIAAIGAYCACCKKGDDGYSRIQ